MGVVNSKSPLERRNTVLRRSQRKSIHKNKANLEKIAKDIKKFKGVEENSDYIDLKARIESNDRELRHSAKNLQPQLRNIHQEALKKVEELYKLLDIKIKENQEKVEENDKPLEFDDNKTKEKELEEAYKRKTVEIIRLEPVEASPQAKRLSVMKIGVPVMPGSMMDSLRRSKDLENLGAEEKITEIRSKIEKLEIEISQFIGKKRGKHYNNLQEQLDNFSQELRKIRSDDEAVLEQIRLCQNYIGSCLSFLDEKAVDEQEDDEVFIDNQNTTTNLSPRSIRTTYI